MCPITINKALLLQEGILKFELSWTAVVYNIDQIVNLFNKLGMPLQLELSGYLLIYNKKMKSMMFMKVGV